MSLVSFDARGDELAYHASLDPALTLPPRVGEVTLQTRQAAAYRSAEGWTGVFIAGAVWGLPLFGRLAPKLRLEMPVLEERSGMRAGSPRVTVGFASSFPLGPVTVGMAVDGGVEVPSFGGTTFEVLGDAFAERKTHPYVGLSVPISVPRFGLSAVLWSTLQAAGNVEVDYVAPRRRFSLRAGIGLATEGQPSRWFAGTGVRLARDVEVSASVSVARDPPGAAVVGLSGRWSLPTEVTRTIPWEGADARVLHADELAGRDLEALGVWGKATIVEVSATWCPPCVAARPWLEQLARRPNVAVRIIDIDECPEFAKRYKVRAVPTFFVFDAEGRLLVRATGATAAEIDRALPP